MRLRLVVSEQNPGSDGRWCSMMFNGLEILLLRGSGENVMQSCSSFPAVDGSMSGSVNMRYLEWWSHSLANKSRFHLLYYKQRSHIKPERKRKNLLRVDLRDPTNSAGRVGVLIQLWRPKLSSANNEKTSTDCGQKVLCIYISMYCIRPFKSFMWNTNCMSH